MKFCLYDTYFSPLTIEQKLTALKLMQFLGGAITPSSNNIDLVNRIISRSSKAMGISANEVHSFDFENIEEITSVLKSIPNQEALDILFQVYFNIVAVSKDLKALKVLYNIYEFLGYVDVELEDLIKKGQQSGVFLTNKTPDFLFLNKIAISMGNMNMMLNEIEDSIKTSTDVIINCEVLYTYAYICRISILDRIDEHRGHLSDDTTIFIPTLFGPRKETMESAINLTIQRLFDIAYLDEVVGLEVDNILKRKGKFDEINTNFPDEQKQQIMS